MQDQPISPNKLGEIATLANRQLTLEREIEELEDLVSKKKEQLKMVSEITIPETMMGLGLLQIKLLTGEKLTVAPFYSTKIPDEKKIQAFSWLTENDFDSIIKCEVAGSFPRGERKLALTALDFVRRSFSNFSLEESIHYQTLKAFVKERVESGSQFPRDLFGVYVGNKTTIK
jgi:hypothetical protein